ncbi:hypothetical protein [Pseudomonas aeruginosa]|uniref:hypothetical protein n=1 Tax=Pseudomonas aeruginosa TaxID=287 RepID=UPI00255AC9E3|nr:hypothetical protein [Pseudomonas aeruginosa]MDL4523929.1 hypothetical protein [Pseudomonas aeruginosa]
MNEFLQGQQVDLIRKNMKNHYRAVVFEVFRAYVESWYEDEFQDVVFSQNQNEGIRRMISSLLAVMRGMKKTRSIKNAKRRLSTLAEYCREGLAQERGT